MAFLSLDHRFIFIHIYKNAGTSITSALNALGRNELGGSQNSTVWSNRYLDKLLKRVASKRCFLLVPTASLVKGVERLKLLSMLSNGHLTFRQFEENLDVSSFFTFAVVRNPWSWQVSLYNYARKNSFDFQRTKPQYADFNAYIAWRCSDEVRLQKYFLIDHKFNLGTNYIMRYESLNENWIELGQKMGFTLPALPKLNISTDNDYRAYYTDETAELVGKRFRLDIETFDYSFDR